MINSPLPQKSESRRSIETQTIYRPWHEADSSTVTFPIEFNPRLVGDYQIAPTPSSQVPDRILNDSANNLQWLSSIRVPWYQLHSRVYKLIQPIWIQIEGYSSGYLVTDQKVNRHGVGPTIDDAIEDYEDTLINYYESLNNRRNKLSSRLTQHLDYLTQKLVPVLTQ
jgi:hypothetical protein